MIGAEDFGKVSSDHAGAPVVSVDLRRESAGIARNLSITERKTSQIGFWGLSESVEWVGITLADAFTF